MYATPKHGETITTLDGVDRKLTDEACWSSPTRTSPIAIAGVMGGEYSGIMDDTTTIVFESACFNGLLRAHHGQRPGHAHRRLRPL